MLSLLNVCFDYTMAEINGTISEDVVRRNQRIHFNVKFRMLNVFILIVLGLIFAPKYVCSV